MVDNVNSCGRSLLDVINHVLDFAKINNSKKFLSLESDHNQSNKHNSQEGIDPNLPRVVDAQNNLDVELDLSLVIEEVAETVFAGHVYSNPSRSRDSSKTTSPYRIISITGPMHQKMTRTILRRASSWSATSGRLHLPMWCHRLVRGVEL